MRKKSTSRKKSAPRGYKYTKRKCRERSNLLKKIIRQVQRIRPQIFTSHCNECLLCTEPDCLDVENGLSQYTIYCIVNTSYFTTKGNLTASVARGFLKLINKIDTNRAKARILNDWEDAGEKLIVLDGINHRHLQYLADEVEYAAAATHLLYQNWGRSQLILVLSVLGREEDLEFCFDGLTYLR